MTQDESSKKTPADGKEAAVQPSAKKSGGKKHFDIRQAAASVVENGFGGKGKHAAKKTKKRVPRYDGKNLDFTQEEYAHSLAGDKLDSETLPRPKPASVDVEQYEADYMGGGKKKTASRGFTPVREKTVGDMLRQYSGKTWFRVTVFCFGLAAGLLLAFNLYVRFSSQVRTETVSVVPYAETIDVEGIAIRDETAIPKNYSGSAVNAVHNGEKVSKGQTVINVFGSSDAAAAYERMAEIDREIEELQSMVTASEDSADAVKNIENLLDEQMLRLNDNICKNDLSDIAEIKGNVTYLLNKRLVAMRKVEDYGDRIAQLEQERQSLETAYTQQPSAVEAPASGYYADALDGYEDLLDTSMLADLTAESLEEIMSRKKDVPDSSAGKLLKDFTWYLACPVPEKQAQDYLSVGSAYTLVLPYSETGSLRAVLSYLNKTDGSDTVLAIFKCSSLISELCDLRRQPVKIQIRSYEGFMVKASALHVSVNQVKEKHKERDVVLTREERHPCVYVVMAGQLFERRIDILYTGDNFVICNTKPDGSNYLYYNEEIVTEGKDLYAGKIIK